MFQAAELRRQLQLRDLIISRLISQADVDRVRHHQQLGHNVCMRCQNAAMVSRPFLLCRHPEPRAYSEYLQWRQMYD